MKKSDLVKMGLYLESLTQKEGIASELASSDERKKKARRAVAWCPQEQQKKVDTPGFLL